MQSLFDVVCAYATGKRKEQKAKLTVGIGRSSFRFTLDKSNGFELREIIQALI
jgi:hypothetical protein